ncbi:MAG: ComEA family DNA-binding protein, partial [bacterium]
DINTADASRLNELPGVGEVTAGKIVKYREKYGEFARPEDIEKVTGIGPTTFKKMKDRIEVSSVSGVQSPRESSSGGKVNINRASAEELEQLPGVGVTYAERIVEYRSKHGSFSSLDELTRVSGIGPVTVSKLRSEAEI